MRPCWCLLVALSCKCTHSLSNNTDVSRQEHSRLYAHEDRQSRQPLHPGPVLPTVRHHPPDDQPLLPKQVTHQRCRAHVTASSNHERALVIRGPLPSARIGFVIARTLAAREAAAAAAVYVRRAPDQRTFDCRG